MHSKGARVAILAALACHGATLCLAQSYPVKPIRLVAGTSPGGITDFLARSSAEGAAALLGQQIVVENRPGATGNLASELVARSAPDGYTLLMVAGGDIVIAPWLYRSLTIKPVDELAPVFNVAEAPQLLLIPATLPVKTVQEFIAYIKANPGKMNYASAGIGSTTHLAADRFTRIAGVQMTHIPYKGTSTVLADLVAGRVQMISMGLQPVRGQITNGQLRPLATAAKKRLPALPDVPTAAEAGLPGYEMTTWFGILGPKAISPDVVRVLNSRYQSVIDEPKYKARLIESGIEPIGGSAESFAERVRADYRMWGELIKDAGLKAE
ncbi:MAG: tripartite tricarboxylate transporter substrate binding protein [Betaproteobacteria bacterium]|nr:tripartite tricarboxylate transporter substrate binding protein [Betaproteobacteria bacterium]